MEGKATGDFLDEPDAVVLVPLDGSELAEQALPQALVFARAYRRRFRSCAWCLPSSSPALAQRQCASASEHNKPRTTKHARIWLRRVFASARKHGPDVQTLRLHGEPAECLTRLTGEHPGSLMVMCTHGRGGLTRALLGSVSAEVVRRSAIPLVVVPRGSASRRDCDNRRRSSQRT